MQNAYLIIEYTRKCIRSLFVLRLNNSRINNGISENDISYGVVDEEDFTHSEQLPNIYKPLTSTRTAYMCTKR